MKDKNIRLTIENTANDVEELKEDLDRIEEKIDKLRWKKLIKYLESTC